MPLTPPKKTTEPPRAAVRGNAPSAAEAMLPMHRSLVSAGIAQTCAPPFDNTERERAATSAPSIAMLEEMMTAPRLSAMGPVLTRRERLSS